METKNMNYTDDQQTFNNDLTNPAQVVLLASGLLHNFVTRTDNYSVQNADGTYYAQNRELTLSAIQDHIEGKTTIGAYSLDQENRVKYVTLDIDLAKSKIDQIEEFKPVLADTAKRVIVECRAFGVEPILEFSGFKGYHVTVLFEELVPAIQAKRFGETIVQRVGQLPDHLHIEVFPKQDVLTPTQPLGNLVKLPLALHKVSKQRSQFLDADTFEPVEDPLEFLRNAPKTAATQVLEVVGTIVEVKQTIVNRPARPRRFDRTGLQQMVDNCPVMRKFEANPVGWAYDPWLGIASAYIEFEAEGGWDRFVQLSKQDTANFSQREIDRIYEEVRHFDSCQGYKRFQEQGVDFKMPPPHIRRPIDWALTEEELQSTIHEENGRYIRYKKLGKEWIKVVVTEFTINPVELLEIQNGEILDCEVTSILGRTYKGILIANTDWYNKTKLLTAIGHMDCTFLGNGEQDTQRVCSYVSQRVTVRKTGTPMIGLHDDLWVLKGTNIDRNGYVNPTRLVAYDKSAESLHNRIVYGHVEDQQFREVSTKLFSNLIKLNKPGVILPVLGWYFATPLKPRIKEITGAFPILFCNGTQGGGKTSLVKKMQSLFGYTDASPYLCTMKEFPTRKILSSTNAVPVFMDEFKPHRMSPQQVDFIMNTIRQLYGGEIEEKGRADQSLTAYNLEAPLVLCGEAATSESAVLERCLMPGFTDIVKRDAGMIKAFEVVSDLCLDGFMERYIPFCLRQDVKQRWIDARDKLEQILNGKEVNPRIKNNLTLMLLGLGLMADFASEWGASVESELDLPRAVTDQISEITGDGDGRTKVAAALLVEQLSRMNEKGLLVQGRHWTYASPRSLDDKTYLCIHLESAIEEFRPYAKRIDYTGEIFDERGYRRQFEGLDYVENSNFPVKFSKSDDGKTKRAVLIDVTKAVAAGLDLTGF